MNLFRSDPSSTDDDSISKSNSARVPLQADILSKAPPQRKDSAGTRPGDSAPTKHLNLGEPHTHISEDEVLSILAEGEMQEVQILPHSSNYNLLTLVQLDDVELPAVYKPQRGETPLWDFTTGTLCKREVAAYLVSKALGWSLIPPTALRQGNFGLGSVQLYIEHDSQAHYFTVQDDARYTDILRKLAIFDFITNNADRKSGHCLIDRAGRLWAIDHGICFHHEYKLRTVIWGYSGSSIEPTFMRDLDRMRAILSDSKHAYTARLGRLLSVDEQLAMIQRVDHLIARGVYPTPLPHRRNYPWPPV